MENQQAAPTARRGIRHAEAAVEIGRRADRHLIKAQRAEIAATIEIESKQAAGQLRSAAAEARAAAADYRLAAKAADRQAEEDDHPPPGRER